MKNILIFILFFIATTDMSHSQEEVTYYLEIANRDYIPEVENKSDRTLKLKIKDNLRDANKINALLSQCTIYDMADIFSESTSPNLRNKIVITLSKDDDIEDLIKRFPQYFPSYIKEIVYESLTPPPTYYPNDFENSGLLVNIAVSSYDDYEQNELKMIRAPEAWHITKGNPDVIIGIADEGFDVGDGQSDPGHEDLADEFIGGILNYNNQYGTHGNKVAGFASAKTDNGLGTSAIGFNTKMIGARGGSLSNLLQLAQFDPKPKVVNLSFGWDGSFNQYEQNIINDIQALDVTIVIAGGNGQDSGSGNPNTYYWPASYKNVIAVSSVGNKNEIGSTTLAYDNWKDVHDVIDVNHNNQLKSHQHNDSIDIVVPEYFPGVRLWKDPDHNDPWIDNYRRTGIGGTSFSAPIVAGTIGLMHSVNYCIKPKEVETILKLTAVKIDNLPQNIQYYGKLGAGRLDAYEAVKMAKDMADPFGTVEVKNRILYRPWFYKLETAPYEIKMTNNDVTGGSKLKFKARNNIEILSGDYYPSTGGYIDLSVNSTLALDCPPPQPSSGRNNVESKTETNYINGAVLENNNDDLLVFPNPTKEILNIGSKDDLDTISISDITGKVIYYIKDINKKELKINMTTFNSGMYFAKIKIKTGEITSVKIIKE